MEMAYRGKWQAEIEAARAILADLPLTEERKWGKPCFTQDGNNIVILQGFKDYFALGFFKGALLRDPRKLLVQLGQTQALRVMKFASAKQIAARSSTIKAYVSTILSKLGVQNRIEAVRLALQHSLID